MRYATIWVLLLALCSLAAAAESPAPPVLVSTQQNFTFFVCGDNRNGDEIYAQILAAANARHAAFLVNTGDLVPYGSDADWRHFRQLMATCKVPFFPVAGNHDTGSGGSLDGFLAFTPTRTAHYSFDAGQLHFTMVNDANELRPEELAWMEADLKATTQAVKVVVHHHPAWNPGGPVYGMYAGREPFLALLEKYHVRYDFCGHDHGYFTGVTNGTTLVITGGAGAGLYHTPEKGGFNHYVAFNVAGTNVSFQVVPVGR